MPFHHQRLPNGLTILAETNPEAHTAGVGYFVRTGARDEPAHLMGVSHFLEHMMFKGTARRTGAQVNCEFDDIGANYNAFTSHESTVYYAQVLPEFTHQAVDLLTDLMQPILRQDDFQMEKQVILEEISMYEDKPGWRLQDALLERHFQGHPLAHRVLGTLDSIHALSDEQLQDYHRTCYRPDNMIFVAAGRIDYSLLVEQLEHLTAGWLPGGTQRLYNLPAFTPSQCHLMDDKLNRHYLAMAMPAPSAQDDDRFAMRVLADLLGDVEGSRLYWALVDPGLAEDASLSFEPQDHAGLCMSFVSCDPARAGQVTRVLQQTLVEIQQGHRPVQEEELVRVKNKLATHATLAGEQPMGRLSSLGASWLYLNRYVPLEEELARLMTVTTEDVTRVLERWPLTCATQVSLGPENK